MAAPSRQQGRALIWIFLACLLVFRLLPAGARIAQTIRHSLVHDWPVWVSVGVWVVFSLYWEIAAANSAADKSSEATSSRALHVFMANAAVLLLFLRIPALTARFLPARLSFFLIGLALQGFALLLAIQARRHLGRNWSGRITIKVGHELVTSGPYRIIRHPIYTGILGLYAGTAIVIGEWHAAVGLAVAVVTYWRKMRLEEANLAGAFGPAWTDYRSSTWALLPGLL